jgi:hypothetical protein
VRVSLKYGFFRNREKTYGGHNDYDAHLVLATMQYRFAIPVLNRLPVPGGGLKMLSTL